MQPRRKDEQLAQDGRFKNRLIVFLLIMQAVALWKFSTYPSQLDVYTAPDISRAFVQRVGDVPAGTVYGFARTLWETVNYCEKDCRSEYPAALNKYNAFFTKSCLKDLNDRFARQAEFFDARARRLLPTDNAVSDLSKVSKQSTELWHLVLEYQLDDDINGVTTRNQIMQYPLKIVHNSVPTQYNPWGLAIDCFWEEPRVIQYNNDKLEKP